MQSRDAVRTLAALAHDARLAVFFGTPSGSAAAYRPEFEQRMLGGITRVSQDVADRCAVAADP